MLIISEDVPIAKMDHTTTVSCLLNLYCLFLLLEDLSSHFLFICDLTDSVSYKHQFIASSFDPL